MIVLFKSKGRKGKERKGVKKKGGKEVLEECKKKEQEGLGGRDKRGAVK